MYEKRDESYFLNGCGFSHDSKEILTVQGLSTVVATGVSTIVTMPLDTIKTRLQVLDTK